MQEKQNNKSIIIASLKNSTMKNYHLKLLMIQLTLLCLSMKAFAQSTDILQQHTSQRICLCEAFDGENCPFCAQLMPPLDSMLNSKPNKVVTIKYFLDWGWGTSPTSLFYYDNINDVNSRASYYGVIGIPNGFIDGVPAFYGTGGGIVPTAIQIDTEYQNYTPFTIRVSHQLTSNNDSVYVHVCIRANAPAFGIFKARVAVIERELNFPNPHGSNLTYPFEGLMKKMLPDANGIILPTTFSAGDSVVLDYKWKLAHMYDISQLAVVAFVEDDIHRYVWQTGYSAPQPWSTSLSDNYNEIEHVKFSPNPFTTYSVVIIPESIMKNNSSAELKLFDISGREVEHTQIKSSEFLIGRDNLPSGIYFWRLTSENKLLDSGKLIME